MHKTAISQISMKWKLTRFGDEIINLHRNSRSQCSIACRYQNSRHLHTSVKLSSQLPSKSIQGPAQTSKIQVSEVNLDMLLLSSCQNDYQGDRIQVWPLHPSYKTEKFPHVFAENIKAGQISFFSDNGYVGRLKHFLSLPSLSTGCKYFN